jgi:SET domain-containing protein
MVRPSSIVGRGLFARTSIGKGEIVCVKGGHLLHQTELAHYKSVAREADLQIADDLFLAPISEAEFEQVMMFLNHSCEPNVGVRGQIVFVAMRDITAGEELTLDYATIDHDSEPMVCRCGAGTCRGLITGQDWQKAELQHKYGNYFAWYLLEKIRAQQGAAVERPHDQREESGLLDWGR